jgi:hypothetical protein
LHGQVAERVRELIREICHAAAGSVSSGNVTDEVIMQYLESQDVEQKDDDFHITQ